MFKDSVVERFTREFGAPSRVTAKVTAFDVNPSLGVVVQTDQPNREDAAFVWLPYPPDGQPIPEISLEYAAESGRHSNTYASAGLERGKPALKLILRSDAELDDTVSYIDAMRRMAPLPVVVKRNVVLSAGAADSSAPVSVDILAMPRPPEVHARREAIPRIVQREVWQRDGGRCTECQSKEKLCFDHIVPFSRGGGNSIRNLQLLCETCNLSKGNRI